VLFPDLIVHRYDLRMDLAADARELTYRRSVLAGAYVELSIPNGSPDDVELAIRAARLLTPTILRELAADVSDPHPWVLFLRRLLEQPETPEAIAAFERLYNIAQQMLDEQGFELVRPEDLLAPRPLERRLQPYLSDPI
jgi:hypothetical protein